MATTAQFSIATTRTQIVETLPFDQTVLLHCASGSVYVGDSTVTTSTGFRLDNGDKLTLPVGDHEGLWAIAAASSTVYVYTNTN